MLTKSSLMRQNKASLVAMLLGDTGDGPAQIGMEQFLGKEVQIYPGDSASKWGIVRGFNEAGVFFEITRKRERGIYTHFKVGEVVFISFSARLNFKLSKED